MMRGYVVAGVVVGLSLACACSPTGQANRDSTASAVKVERLAQGPVKNLPAGKVFVNILEFRQLPGAVTLVLLARAAGPPAARSERGVERAVGGPERLDLAADEAPSGLWYG